MKNHFLLDERFIDVFAKDFVSEIQVENNVPYQSVQKERPRRYDKVAYLGKSVDKLFCQLFFVGLYSMHNRPYGDLQRPCGPLPFKA